jgi:ribonuclease P protein subunit POP4
MSITKRNLLQHELIGLDVEVIKSSDQSVVGKSGKIVDESHHMLVVEEKGKLKRLQKSTAVFRVTLPNGEKINVNGRKLVSSPEDRIKKCG